MIPKPTRYESKSYRQFVAGHACFACGIEGLSQCAHANGGGMGTKRSDLETFPLCCARPGDMGCHAKHDQCIGMRRKERRDVEAAYIERMQGIARSAGRVELGVTA